MIKKSSKRTISLLLLITLTSNTIFLASATETESSTVKLTQEIIEQYTEDMNIVTNTFQENGFIAVADGADTIVKIPEIGSEPIQLKAAYDDQESFSINLPEEAAGIGEISDRGTVVYENNEGDAHIGVQAISDNGGFEGVRSLITIEDHSASKEYSFAFNFEQGTRLMKANDYFGDIGEGYSIDEVYIVNSEEQIIGVIDAPWAYDANGNKVSTYYKINGNNELIQIIEFDENSVFPIVADPSAWQIAKCAGAVTWAIGSTIFAGAKILKLKKYIAALGGLRTAVTLMLYCSTNSERLQVGGQALLEFTAIIFGVDAIREQCF